MKTLARGVRTEDRMGRPKRASEHSSKLVAVRITEAEFEALRAHCEALGTNASSAIRELLADAGYLTMPTRKRRREE